MTITIGVKKEKNESSNEILEAKANNIVLKKKLKLSSVIFYIISF